MLPLFRLIPVGGVFLAIAILLLALNPPRAASPSAHAALQPVRGALIDRSDHPEWRQFLIQAALRRADEVERLRGLRDTVVRNAPPVAMAPVPVEAEADVAEAPHTNATPEVAEALSAETIPETVEAPSPAEAGPEAAEAGSTVSEPAAEPTFAEAAPVDAARETTSEPKIAGAATIEAQPDTTGPAQIAIEPEADTAEPKAAATPVVAEPEPATVEPKDAGTAPVEAAPEITTGSEVADAASIGAKPDTTEPAPVAAAPAAGEAEPAAAEPNIAAATRTAEVPAGIAPASAPSTLEVEARTQMASIALPSARDAKPTGAATPSQEDAGASAPPLETNGSRIRADLALPAATRIAGLPEQPVEKHSDDITGSIEPADHAATIPVGIGEASSTELMVTLPRERPPVLREFDLRRARDSKVKQPRRRVHHATPARKVTKPEVIPPEFAFFALLIKAFNPDARFDPNVKFEPIKPPAISYQPNNRWQENR